MKWKQDVARCPQCKKSVKTVSESAPSPYGYSAVVRCSNAKCGRKWHYERRVTEIRNLPNQGRKGAK